MKVDVYDFDKTVVPYDSGMKYWFFCMKHNPWIIPLFPFQALWGFLMFTHIVSIDTFKKVAFTYVALIDNKKNVKAFWDEHEKDVYDWFKSENRPRTAVLISASPDFVINEIAERMKVEYCLATVHDMKNGVKHSKVCRHERKVDRLYEILPDAVVEDVFSDSIKSDKWIFSLGKRAFKVTNGVRELIDASAIKFKRGQQRPTPRNVATMTETDIVEEVKQAV